jgi:protein O-mannosyl-transferase
MHSAKAEITSMHVDKTSQFRIGLLALGVGLVILLIYWPGLSGGFIFDDYPIFADNPAAHVSGWHWQAWRPLLVWSVTNVQRPLAMATYGANYAWGAGPFGFKATNLCLHLLNTLLVFLLTRRLLTTCWQRTAASSTRKDYWALAISLAWAIHPLQISTVMYVVQRMEMLGLTFTLLALLAYWKARENQIQGDTAWPWLILCFFLVLIGLSAKETAILVPGYTLLLELVIFHFRALRPAFSATWKYFYLAGAIAAFALTIVYFGPHYTSAAAYITRDFTPWQRELTQLRALPMYVGWSVLPLPTELHFYYDNYLLSTDFFHPYTTWLGGVFLLGLVALAIAVRRHRPLLALGIGWFFVAHALTSSPVPLELVFEHRNYPALLGVMLALADVVWMLTLKFQSRLPMLLAALFLINLCFLATLRAATWGNPLELAVSLAQSNPGSTRAALDLARRYVEMSGDDPANPLYGRGIDELKRAASLPSQSVLPEEALLIQASRHPEQNSDTARWWAALQHKLQTGRPIPDNYLALNNLLQQRLGSTSNIDAQQLGIAFEEAITRNPTRISLHTQYAELAARALHEPDVASREWRTVVALQHASPDDVLPLATYLVDNHRDQEAAAVLDEALHQRPQLQENPVFDSLEARIRSTKAAAPSPLPQ